MDFDEGACCFGLITLCTNLGESAFSTFIHTEIKLSSKQRSHPSLDACALPEVESLRSDPDEKPSVPASGTIASALPDVNISLMGIRVLGSFVLVVK